MRTSIRAIAEAVLRAITRRPRPDYALIARLEVELGFVEPKITFMSPPLRMIQANAEVNELRAKLLAEWGRGPAMVLPEGFEYREISHG